MTKCKSCFQFALLGLVAAASAAPSGILAGGLGLGGLGYAAGGVIAAPAIIRSYPLADAVPAGLNGLQVKKLGLLKPDGEL